MLKNMFGLRLDSLNSHHSQVFIYVAVAHQTSQAPDTQITKTDSRAICKTGVKFCLNPLV